MAGGKGPRRKGFNYEREIVKQAIASGFDKSDTKRAYGSDGRSLGLAVSVDCLIGGKRVQAFRPASIRAKLVPDDDVDAVAVRPDFGESLVVIRYSDWLNLLLSAGKHETTEAD